jgi:RNA-binding protein
MLNRIMPDAEPNLRELKSRAQQLKPTIRLGKAGLTAEFLAAFDEALQRVTLVKLRFEDFKDERKTLSKQLAEQSGSRLVQQVGHTAVFYRAKGAPVSKPEGAAEDEA